MNKLYLFFISTMLVLFTACKDENKPSRPPLEFTWIAVSAGGETRTSNNKDNPFVLKEGNPFSIQGNVRSNISSTLRSLEFVANYHSDKDISDDDYDIDEDIRKYTRITGVPRVPPLKSYNFNFRIGPKRGVSDWPLKKGLYIANIYVYDSSGLRKMSDQEVWFRIE